MKFVLMVISYPDIRNKDLEAHRLALKDRLRRTQNWPIAQGLRVGELFVKFLTAN